MDWGEPHSDSFSDSGDASSGGSASWLYGAESAAPEVYYSGDDSASVSDSPASTSSDGGGFEAAAAWASASAPRASWASSMKKF